MFKVMSGRCFSDIKSSILGFLSDSFIRKSDSTRNRFLYLFLTPFANRNFLSTLLLKTNAKKNE